LESLKGQSTLEPEIVIERLLRGSLSEEEAMHALQKRRKRWEYENQLQLERTFEFSRKLIQKQIVGAARFTSFLLYVLYKGSRLMIGLFQALWTAPKDVDQRLSDAEQQRLKHSSHPSLWLK
jgi:hypothetical protein